MEETVPEATDVAPRHVRWIQQNAVRFNSIDPADTDFSDLQSLKQMIGDARIVQLGEQSHGDGACFQTKIRLIKFLHQEMGYDVLAFESGIYDCRRAWQAFQQGTDPEHAARTGVFGIWTGSKQTAELWSYLADQASSNKPLELAGFDCQFTGTASQQYLADDIRKLAAKYAPKLETARIDALVDQLGITQPVKKQPRDVEQNLLVIDELQTALTAATQSTNKTEREQQRFWQQNLKSIKQQYLNQSREYDGKGIARPLGYAWMRANWYRHFDAMVFNKTMSPSTGR